MSSYQTREINASLSRVKASKIVDRKVGSINAIQPTLRSTICRQLSRVQRCIYFSRLVSVLFFLFSTSFMVCATYAGLNEEWEPMEDEAISIAEAPRSSERPRVTHRDEPDQTTADRSEHVRKFPRLQKSDSQVVTKKSKSRNQSIKEEYQKKRAERIRAAKAQRPTTKNEK